MAKRSRTSAVNSRGRSPRAGAGKLARKRPAPGLLDSVLATSLAGIAVLRGREYRYELVNPAYQALAPDREFVGRTLAECWPDLVDRVKPLLDGVLDTGVPFHVDDMCFEIERGTPGVREEAYFTFTYQPVQPDARGEPRILATVVETTRRIQEQREADERLRLALSASRAGMWEWDLRTNENVWSDGLWELYGLRRAGRTASYDTWLESLHPVDRERAQEAVRSAVARGEPVDVDYRVRTPDGGERWLCARGAPVRDRSGNGVRYRGVVFDITASRRQVQLTAEKERTDALHQAVAELPIGVVLIEVPPDGPPAIAGHNAAYRRLVTAAPYEPTPIEQLRYGIFRPDRVTPVPPPEWPGPRAALLGEVVHDEELHLRRADGSWRIISVSAAPFGPSDPEGIRHAVAVLLDVTEQKTAAEALAASEEKFRSLVDNAADAFFLHDFQGRFREVNRRACESLGYTREELLRMRVTDVEQDFQLPAAQAQWAKIQPGTPLGLLGHQRRKDGTVFPVELNFAAVDIGGERLYMAFVRDISERERVERALRESERRFRDVAASAGEYVFEMDGRGVVTYISDAAEKVLGYRSEEIVGRSSLELMDADEQARSMAFLGEMVARKEGFTHFQQTATHRDGRRVWLDISAVPVLAADGSLVGYRGTAMDVTERHEAEVERARLQAQLSQAQKMEVVGRLAGGVAHDFNNLLTVILSCGLELRDALRAGQMPDPENAADVVTAAQRAADLTRQLLAFARKQVVSPEVIDLNDVLRQARKLLGRVIGEDVRVVEDLGEGLWAVRADPGLLSQVIMNLAVNARDAMPHGGSLHLATSNFHLDQGAMPPDPEMTPGEFVRLRVADTGVGMAPEVLAHAFEPFFSTKAVGTGTGLGLATVYGIVRQSGGFVTVRSARGQGTEFDVYLPALPAEVRAAVREAESVAGGAETVLVAEDEPRVREITEKILRAAGYHVLSAGSGEEALEIATREAGPVHLLVTDVIMPGMGGQDLARALFALRPGTRVLFVSGYTDDAIGRRGILDEGVAFLQKPFTPRELLVRVRAALDALAARDG